MASSLSSGMGIWFEHQIVDLLRAVDFANANVITLVPTPEAKLYQMGFEAAIEAVARGFGVESARRQSRIRE